MSKFSWRHFAQKEPGWWNPPAPEGFQQSQLESIRALLEKDRPTRVLEIGVGRGRATPWLRSSWTYVGVEVNRSLLTLAKARGVEPIALGTGTVLPFRNDSFGAVVAYDVLMHVWDRCGFLDECRRVLVPEGMLVANYLRKFSRGWRRYVLAWLLHPLRMLESRDRRFDLEKELRAAVSNRGFRTEFLMNRTSSPILVARKFVRSFPGRDQRIRKRFLRRDG